MSAAKGAASAQKISMTMVRIILLQPVGTASALARLRFALQPRGAAGALFGA